MYFAPVIRRSTFAPYSPALRQIDRGLERFLSDALLAPAPGFARAVTLADDAQATTLQLDLPGLAREQLSIQLEDNLVRIESTQDAPRQLKARYALAQDIDPTTSEAKLEHGVLTLKLGKKQPVSNATALQIA